MKTAVIGSFIVDLMARAPHLPEPGETVMGSYFSAGPGGKGANQAVAAKRAGCDLIFSTKIGTDAFSQIALDTFRENGIELDYVFRTEHAPTGTALITVSEATGQNEIVVVPGACNTYTDEDIARLDQALNGCAYLLLQLEINMEATDALIQMAYRKGIRVILNTAPIQSLNDELYPQLYLVTPNEVEAGILTGISCDTAAGCTAAAGALLEKGVQNVIITLGARGVYLSDGKAEYFLPNFDVPVLDTTGAGDAFNGGLLSGLSKGMPLYKAALYGNIISNLAVTRMGTGLAMPQAQEIEKFMLSHGIVL